VVEHLVAVETLGPLGGAVGLLEEALAVTARKGGDSAERVKFDGRRVYCGYVCRGSGLRCGFGGWFGELEAVQGRVGYTGGSHQIRTHVGHVFITAR
jgi:hypothetical protein